MMTRSPLSRVVSLKSTLGSLVCAGASEAPASKSAQIQGDRYWRFKSHLGEGFATRDFDTDSVGREPSLWEGATCIVLSEKRRKKGLNRAFSSRLANRR